jgi:hypothetical protein
MNRILYFNRVFYFTVSKANRRRAREAHGILHETTTVIVVVSRYFQRLGNELAECRGDETDSFSSLNQRHIIKKMLCHGAIKRLL